jgi:hypothetical protein
MRSMFFPTVIGCLLSLTATLPVVAGAKNDILSVDATNTSSDNVATASLHYAISRAITAAFSPIDVAAEMGSVLEEVGFSQGPGRFLKKLFRLARVRHWISITPEMN